MAKDDKTEKPTEKRRSDAREEGQVAKSPEIAMAISLALLSVAVQVIIPVAGEALREQTAAVLASPVVALDEVGRTVQGLLTAAAGLLGPILAVGVFGALAGGFAQVGFKPAPKAAKPKLSKLSPKQGLSKLKPSESLWELVRTALKLGALVAVTWGPMTGWTDGVGDGLGLVAGLGRLGDTVVSLLLRVALLAAVIAAADYAWKRRSTEKQLRMSKQDVKDEHKNAEGDPRIKSQRRSKMLALSRNRMIQAVAQADVVITNPTHVAVALSYSDGDVAPRVVARGADERAARIRTEARRHGIVVTEEPPLARALYRRCQVGDFVPAALFEAVAVVLAVAYRRRGRTAA